MRKLLVLSLSGILLISGNGRDSLQAQKKPFSQRLSDAALELTRDTVVYDPSYFRIPYPGGDVPALRGVCTDVVIRAYRKLGVDLQKNVHLDMKAHFSAYPRIWGARKPDANIDHRRVPNLMKYFSRHGRIKKITQNPRDYLPGDIVCWELRPGVTHIGIVVDRRAMFHPERYAVVHNIGAGQVLEDILFDYPIIGHYTYAPG